MSLPPSPLRTDRRSFIRHFALSTAVSMAGGKLWTARVLADVGPLGEPFEPIIIKLTDYPALLNQNGSVRFRFMGLDGGTFPFALNRADETTFYAVDTRCTHAGCMVNAFESTRFAMVCDCHQSEYDIMGRVQAGPAVNDLIRYNVTYDGVNKVTVIVPGLDLTIRSVAVVEKTAAAVRVRLDFPTIPFGKYAIQYRQNIEDEPVGVLFATTPTGPATLSDIETNGQLQTVYVDAALPRGFFSVALVVEEI
jgi:Rieske Fe-S protein